MPWISQQHRLLSIETPLGFERVIITQLIGDEALSKPFSFLVDLVSPDDLSPEQWIGKSCCVRIDNHFSPPRYIHGIVQRFISNDVITKDLYSYHIELVPGLRLLSQNSDCRIFQHQSVPDIVATLLKDSGLCDFNFLLHHQYPIRDYCVQYNESTFHFISRLIEDEGIFYYFRHEHDHHELVFGDHLAAYHEFNKFVIYATQTIDEPHVFEWQRRYQHIPTSVELLDTSFQSPQQRVRAHARISQQSITGYGEFRQMMYPGGFTTPAEGERKARLHRDEIQLHYEQIEGAGNHANMMPGTQFHLSSHEFTKEEGDYLITTIHHEAQDHSHITQRQDETRQNYQNTFSAIPAHLLFRPPRLTSKPTIDGPQTARVVSPPGRSIDVDKYGRIKVQFHWDHRRKQSCFVRLTHGWAGNRWGMQFIPRTGQEVLVRFLDGDPDRPFVGGALYNAMHKPPYACPEQKTCSGIKTHSLGSHDAGAGHEICLDDRKEKEQLRLKTQRDYHQSVGNHRLTFIKKNHTFVVEGNALTELLSGKHCTRAGQKITLRCGDNSIVIHSTGIDINGKIVTFNSGMTKAVEMS